MRYLITNDSHFEFSKTVREHHCELRVIPQQDAEQRVDAVRIETRPQAEVFRYTDCFGNVVSHFGVLEPHTSLAAHIEIEVETTLENPFNYQPIEIHRERAWIAEALHAQPRLCDFVLHRSAVTPDLAPFTDEYEFPTYDLDRPLLESAQRANSWVRDTFAYDSERAPAQTSLANVLELRAGVCQDFAHMLISIIRSWGCPVRYAMGYQDPRSMGEDTRSPAPHAWAEVLIPGAGWRGLDATNGLLADHTYVRVAVGRDAGDALPRRGSFKGGGEETSPAVSLQVMRQS